MKTQLAKQVTITEMKEQNKAVGQHWFSKDAMRFFNTRIVSPPNKANIFITSEHNWDESPKYTLRWFRTTDATVHTLGEFNEIETLEEAREQRKFYTQGKKDMGITY